MADTPFIVGLKAILLDAAKFRHIPLGGADLTNGFGSQAYHLATAVADFDRMPLVSRSIAIARTQLGVTESPANSNSGPIVDQYIAAADLRPPEPWCACFQTWVLKHAGYGGPWPAQLGYVPSWEQWAKDNGLWITPARTRIGDLLCYNFDGGTLAQHIGLCIAVGGSTRVAIEGNTSANSDANGGEVAIQTRPMTVVLGGVRLK